MLYQYIISLVEAAAVSFRPLNMLKDSVIGLDVPQVVHNAFWRAVVDHKHLILGTFHGISKMAVRIKRAGNMLKLSHR